MGPCRVMCEETSRIVWTLIDSQTFFCTQGTRSDRTYETTPLQRGLYRGNHRAHGGWHGPCTIHESLTTDSLTGRDGRLNEPDPQWLSLWRPRLSSPHFLRFTTLDIIWYHVRVGFVSLRVFFVLFFCTGVIEVECLSEGRDQSDYRRVCLTEEYVLLSISDLRLEGLPWVWVLLLVVIVRALCLRRVNVYWDKGVQ